MRVLLIQFLFLCTISSVSPETYIGKWRITGGSIIEIYAEGNHFFGKIHKRTANPTSNLNGLDNKNPNPALWQRPLLGMVILDSLSYNDGVLSGGTIYNADSGKSYEVKIWIDADNTDVCYIRAYKAFLFKTFEAYRVQK